MIRTMFRMFAKAFLGLIGLSVGLLCALTVLFSFIASVNGISGSQPGLRLLPDAQGVIKPLGKEAPIVAVIELNGEISRSNQTYKQIQAYFSDMDKDLFKKRLKGVVFHISSPGGEVFEVNQIYSFVQDWKNRRQVPLYIYVDGLCASGGYYIACAGDKICTGDIGIVGSVGIVSSPFFNVKEALTKIGVNSLILSSGKDKATLNPFMDWTDQEKDKRQDLLNFFYDKFVSIVTENRKSLSKERLVDFLGADIFYPEQALSEGLVDQINVSRNQVIEELTETVGIKENYRVIGLGKDNWWKKVVLTLCRSPLVSGQIKHEVTLTDLETTSAPCGYLYDGLISG